MMSSKQQENEMNAKGLSAKDSNESVARARYERMKEKKKLRNRNKWANQHLAMDCEMVGTGVGGEELILARVSIVNRHGSTLMDKYVKPTAEVTNYYTSISGIRPADIENAEEFSVVQKQVKDMLQGKYLVGHGLSHDLSVLKFSHPKTHIRDTATYRKLAFEVGDGRTPSLKNLAKLLVGQEIQNGEHDSVQDAQAAMNIYNKCCLEWEKYLQRKMSKQLE